MINENDNWQESWDRMEEAERRERDIGEIAEGETMQLTCNVCGHRWNTRPGRLEVDRVKPLKCPHPKCQSPDWDKKE